MEAAFFDLDKTVIAKASMAAYAKPLYRAGMISPWLVLRAAWGQFLFKMYGADEEKMRKLRESALRITTGWEQAKVSAVVRDALTDVIEPIVYDEALDLIEWHRQEGRRVFIVSASPEEIVAPLAQYLGVDEAISTRAELDDRGRYTGQVEFYAYGPHKAEAIRQRAELLGIDLERSHAYSDSVTDLPLLEAVGNPVAVNPDRDLLRHATAEEWDVRWFDQRVPLRERVALPPPGAVAASAGIVAASAGVFGVARWTLGRRPPPPPPRRALPRLSSRRSAPAPRIRRRSPASSSRRGTPRRPRGRGG